ncbi:MAG: WxL domain-containing protein [Vagococcus sp.]
MKKNKLLVSTLILGGMFATAASVSAAEGDFVPTEENTAGEITINAPDTQTPVDPEGGEGDGEGTGQIGLLTLDYVPSFNFGEIEISSSTQTVTNTSINPYVQTTDVRGTGEGWSLSLEISPFTSGTEATGIETLKGAIVTISGLTSSVTDTDSTSTAPTSGTDLTFAVGEAAASNVLLNSGMNSGMGTWVSKFEKAGEQSVSLTIPSGNKAGTYTSDFNWTLGNAPA